MKTTNRIPGWLVVAAALTIGFSACSSDDTLTEEPTPQQPAQTATKIHVTVGAGISDATTRSEVDVTTDGETGKKTRTLQFTAGDRLYVYGEYDDMGLEPSGVAFFPYIVAGYLELDTESFDDSDPTNATFTGDLTIYEWDYEYGEYEEEGGEYMLYENGYYIPAMYSPSFSTDDPLADFHDVTAMLIHKDAVENRDYVINDLSYEAAYNNPNACAATVEALMTSGLKVSGLYDADKQSFTLTKDTDQPIVNCTIAGVDPGERYKVDYIYGTTAAMSDHTKALYSSMIPDENGTLAFAFFAETGDKFHGIRLTNTWGDIYDVMEDVSLVQKSFESKVYNATRTAVHVPQTIDLSKASYNITARNGDVLTGTMSNGYYVEIVDGATVTLRGVNISNTLYPIACQANAVIVLDGDNTLTSNSGPGILTWADYSEGDAVPTLEIKGSGSLNVTAGPNYGAAIGSPYSTISYPCGNITISGGTITATAGDYAAAIGCGNNSSCGNITITGGTVIATTSEFAAAIGCGNKGLCGAITISGGTVTATNNSSLYAAIGGRKDGDGSDGSDCNSITITDGITSVAMTNSNETTTSKLSGFAYAANIYLNQNYPLTALQARDTRIIDMSGTSMNGLRYSFNSSTKTLTITKAN